MASNAGCPHSTWPLTECLVFASSPIAPHPATLLSLTELQLIHTLCQVHLHCTLPCPNAFPPSLYSQFETIADTSDSSSSVTLKRYTMHFEVESSACRVARRVMCQMTQACTNASDSACFSQWVHDFSPDHEKVCKHPLSVQVWAILLVIKNLWTSACWYFKKKKNQEEEEKRKIRENPGLALVGFLFVFSDKIVLQWGKVWGFFCL